jgi:hypothetical protein
MSPERLTSSTCLVGQHTSMSLQSGLWQLLHNAGFFNGRRGRHTKLSWGTCQFCVQAACGPRSGSETASSANIRSNRELADFSVSWYFRLFQQYRPRAVIARRRRPGVPTGRTQVAPDRPTPPIPRILAFCYTGLIKPVMLQP